MRTIDGAIARLPRYTALHVELRRSITGPDFGGLAPTTNLPGGKGGRATGGSGGTPLGGRVRAAGRGPWGAESALVGEGKGPEWIVDPTKGSAWKTNGPTFTVLAPTEYVVPTEERYRGRAAGFLAEIMADLGMAFAKGKKPKKKTPAKAKKRDRFVPAAIEPLSLPVEDLTARHKSARDALDKAKKKVSELPSDIRTTQASLNDINRRKATTKAQQENKAEDRKRTKAKLDRQRADLKKAKADVPRLRAEYRQRDKELRDAQRYQQRIKEQVDLANIAGNDMRLADLRDNDDAYAAAKGRRGTALKKLKELYETARKFVKDDTAYARQLDADIGQTDIDIEETENATAEESPDQRAAREAAERLADTGMTDEERASLGDLDAQAELAALTETLDDDKSVAGRRLGMLEAILGEITSGRRAVDSGAVADVARLVKSSRDNVMALSQPGSTVQHDDQNVQAQLERERERANRAEAENRVYAGIQRVFGESGDLGVFNRGPNITINTLHPGDPQVSRAIGDAAAQGFNYQQPRSSPRHYSGA